MYHYKIDAWFLGCDCKFLRIPLSKISTNYCIYLSFYKFYKIYQLFSFDFPKLGFTFWAISQCLISMQIYIHRAALSHDFSRQSYIFYCLNFPELIFSNNELKMPTQDSFLVFHQISLFYCYKPYCTKYQVMPCIIANFVPYIDWKIRKLHPQKIMFYSGNSYCNKYLFWLSSREVKSGRKQANFCDFWKWKSILSRNSRFGLNIALFISVKII